MSYDQELVQSEPKFCLHKPKLEITETRTVRGSGISPDVALSEEKDKLVTENWRD